MLIKSWPAFCVAQSIQPDTFKVRQLEAQVPVTENMHEFSIEISDQQTEMVVEHSSLTSIIERVLVEEQVDRAQIGLALVNDTEIHRVNKQYLGHDYPTDVISFPLHNSTYEDETIFPNADTLANSSDFTTIEGELIVSTETAKREATAHGWSPDAELLLYVVHGLLHLCGYDDIADEERPKMRNRERELLALWGLCPTGLEA